MDDFVEPASLFDLDRSDSELVIDFDQQIDQIAHLTRANNLLALPLIVGPAVLENPNFWLVRYQISNGDVNNRQVLDDYQQGIGNNSIKFWRVLRNYPAAQNFVLANLVASLSNGQLLTFASYELFRRIFFDWWDTLDVVGLQLIREIVQLFSSVIDVQPLIDTINSDKLVITSSINPIDLRTTFSSWSTELAIPTMNEAVDNGDRGYPVLPSQSDLDAMFDGAIPILHEADLEPLDTDQEPPFELDPEEIDESIYAYGGEEYDTNLEEEDF